jgi:hypothetical protein
MSLGVPRTNSDNDELAMEGREGSSWHHTCCSTLRQPGVFSGRKGVRAGVSVPGAEVS